MKLLEKKVFYVVLSFLILTDETFNLSFSFLDFTEFYFQGKQYLFSIF